MNSINNRDENTRTLKIIRMLFWKKLPNKEFSGRNNGIKNEITINHIRLNYLCPYLNYLKISISALRFHSSRDQDVQRQIMLRFLQLVPILLLTVLKISLSMTRYGVPCWDGCKKRDGSGYYTCTTIEVYESKTSLGNLKLRP